MRKKVGTVLDESVLWAAKQAAARRKLPLSRFIEQALEAHLSGPERSRSRKGVSLVLESRGAFKVTSAQLRAVMEEEDWHEA